jgi:hypothetical protein
MWRPDGQELYFVGAEGELVAAAIAVRDGALEPGPPVTLFRPRILGGGSQSAQGYNFSVAPDGRFLVNTVVDDGVSTPITIVQHWQPLSR